MFWVSGGGCAASPLLAHPAVILRSNFPPACASTAVYEPRHSLHVKCGASSSPQLMRGGSQLS